MLVYILYKSSCLAVLLVHVVLLYLLVQIISYNYTVEIYEYSKSIESALNHEFR